MADVLITLAVGIVASVAAMVGLLRGFARPLENWVLAILIGIAGGAAGAWAAGWTGLPGARWLGAIGLPFGIALLAFWIVYRVMPPRAKDGRAAGTSRGDDHSRILEN